MSTGWLVENEGILLSHCW